MPEQTSPEFNLSQIQQKTLELVEARFDAGKKIPGFMLDSVLRMHPLAILEELGDSEDDLHNYFDGIKDEDLTTAWDNAACYPCPISAPYSKTVALPNNIAFPNQATDELEPIDKIFVSARSRRSLFYEILPSTIISQELLDGKEDQVTTEQAIESWLEYQGQTVSNHTVEGTTDFDFDEYIQRHIDQGGDPLPDPEIIIAIPVAGGQEHQTLFKTLSLLANQSLDTSRYEIVLLHNIRLPDEEAVFDPNINPEDTRLTDLYPLLMGQIISERSAISKNLLSLYEQCGNIRLRTLLTINRPRTTVGYLRGEIHRDIARRYLKRGSKNNPLVLNLDADMTSLNHDFLSEMLKTNETNEDPTVFARLKWQAQDHRLDRTLVKKILNLERFLTSVAESLSGTPHPTDCGTAIRLKEYCLAGGHSWVSNFNENGKIVNIIKASKSYQDRPKSMNSLSRRSVHGSDPRRQVDVMARGYNPTRSWDHNITTFATPEDQVRTQQLRANEAELETHYNLWLWIDQMITQHIGDTTSDTFKAKIDVVEKGLKILGLPSPYIKTDEGNYEIIDALEEKPVSTDNQPVNANV